MALLLIGFGLIAHGLGSWFSPPDFSVAPGLHQPG
jgi:hypothetical protein